MGVEHIEYMDGPFEVAISNGVVVFTWPNGARRAVPLNVFRICAARIVRALAEHDMRDADILRFPRKLEA